MSYAIRSSAAVLLAAALLTGGTASAQSQSPFLGEWELDLTRMPANYGPPPKKVLYTFTDIGAGKWRTTIDITAPDDSVRHIAIQYRRDGHVGQNDGDTSMATPPRSTPRRRVRW